MESIKMTRKELAGKIASAIDCTTKVWAKNGKVRVYLSHRGKDYGFVEILSSGVDWSLTSYANNCYGGAIRKAIQGIQIEEPADVSPGLRRLTSAEADGIAKRKPTQRNTNAVVALNAMYGENKWDNRDLEDYEG